MCVGVVDLRIVFGCVWIVDCVLDGCLRCE